MFSKIIFDGKYLGKSKKDVLYALKFEPMIDWWTALYGMDEIGYNI